MSIYLCDYSGVYAKKYFSSCLLHSLADWFASFRTCPDLSLSGWDNSALIQVVIVIIIIIATTLSLVEGNTSCVNIVMDVW